MEPTLLRRDMRYWLLKPDPRLRPFVLCYYFAEPHPEPWSSAPAYHEEELLLPDGHAEIVFNSGAAYERWEPGCPERREVMRHSYVIGGRSHTVLTRDLGPVRVAGVKLDPRLLRHIVGTPLSTFRETTLSLAELGDRRLVELEGAILDAANAGEVAKRFDCFFLRAWRDILPSQPAIDRLVQQIRATRGEVRLMHWIREQRLEARTFERLFCDWIGMSPKRYARLARFKHAYWKLLASDAPPAARDIEGFYDQSHFNREFKRFVGVSPTIRTSGAMRNGTSVTDHLLASEAYPPPLSKCFP
jgi:AraC-like DNA-binding protein